MSRLFPFKVARLLSSGLLVFHTTIATAIVPELLLNTAGISTVPAANATKDADQVYQQVAPKVVYIESKYVNGSVSGSGVILRSDGLIVTNAHVIAGAKQVIVELANGRKYEAEILAQGGEKCLDLALLKIKATNLPALKLAAPASAQTGQRVFAIGYPLGIKPSSITQGIISNIHATAGLVQIDAAVIHGNSGGALVNSRGELIGINTSGIEGDNPMNFAVAVDKVQALLQAYNQGVSPAIGQFVIPTSQGVTRRLRLNTTQQGRLGQQASQMCGDGSYADVYTFEGDTDQPIAIDMSSPEMGSYLLLLGPDGKLVTRSGSEKANQGVTIAAKLPQKGVYTIVANAAKPEQLGRYQISVSTPLLLEWGRLTSSDPRLQDGSFYRSYTFQGTAGEQIAIELMQFDFDPYLVLLDPDGKPVNQGNTKRQDTLSSQLPQNGLYTLIVSTAKPGDRGRYAILVSGQSMQSMRNQISQR